MALRFVWALAMLSLVASLTLHGAIDSTNFVWIYGEVLMAEALALLGVVVFLVYPAVRRLRPVLDHKIKLPSLAKAAAAAALAAGSFLFVFWSAVDVVGGANGLGPGHVLTVTPNPLLVAIYGDMGLGYIFVPDQMGVEGFLGFCIAVLGLMAFRASHGVGTALKDGIVFFAAPLITVFELFLWYRLPVDMYWHATAFTPWSLGKLLDSSGFSIAVNRPGYSLSWGGNVYLLSNWFVLMAASGLTALGLASFLVRKELEREDRLLTVGPQMSLS